MLLSALTFSCKGLPSLTWRVRCPLKSSKELGVTTKARERNTMSERNELSLFQSEAYKVNISCRIDRIISKQVNSVNADAQLPWVLATGDFFFTGGLFFRKEKFFLRGTFFRKEKQFLMGDVFFLEKKFFLGGGNFFEKTNFGQFFFFRANRAPPPPSRVMPVRL